MRFSTAKLTALAKALLSAENSKTDGQMSVAPQISQVLEIPEALPPERIFIGASGPGGDSSFFWSDSTGQIGVNAGFAHDGKPLAPGVWRFKGYMVLQYTQPAVTVPFGVAQISLFDPAFPGNIVTLAQIATTNTSVQLICQYDVVLNLPQGTNFQLRTTAPATIAGDTLTVLFKIHGQRLI